MYGSSSFRSSLDSNHSCIGGFLEQVIRHLCFEKGSETYGISIFCRVEKFDEMRRGIYEAFFFSKKGTQSLFIMIDP